MHQNSKFCKKNDGFKLLKVFGSLLILGATSSCGSIAKGITEAIIEQDGDEIISACNIRGKSFEGMSSLIEYGESKQERKQLKILMVHGIGEHVPGYSARLQKNLVTNLGLTVSQEKYKDIHLTETNGIEGALGNLRAIRYFDQSGKKEAYFYELTWSKITETDKKLLEFDKTGAQTLNRSSLNGQMKSFINSHIPDPLLYAGNKRRTIQQSVIESLCWVYSGDWENLKNGSTNKCDSQKIKKGAISSTNLNIITHSLGSQISLDALQLLAENIVESEKNDPALAKISKELQQSDYSIYMLANQLPLLQLGVDPPKVHNKIPEYCYPSSPNYDKRIFNKTSIYAFSDPNDILSYSVEPKFADNRIDSRLCPTITNISLNVAEKFNLFDLGEVANPLDAHGNYDADERVMDLITHGVGTNKQTEKITKQCDWQDVITEKPSTSVSFNTNISHKLN